MASALAEQHGPLRLEVQLQVARRRRRRSRRCGPSATGGRARPPRTAPSRRSADALARLRAPGRRRRSGARRRGRPSRSATHHGRRGRRRARARRCRRRPPAASARRRSMRDVLGPVALRPAPAATQGRASSRASQRARRRGAASARPRSTATASATRDGVGVGGAADGRPGRRDRNGAAHEQRRRRRAASTTTAAISTHFSLRRRPPRRRRMAARREAGVDRRPRVGLGRVQGGVHGTLAPTAPGRRRVGEPDEADLAAQVDARARPRRGRRTSRIRRQHVVGRAAVVGLDEVGVLLRHLGRADAQAPQAELVDQPGRPRARRGWGSRTPSRRSGRRAGCSRRQRTISVISASAADRSPGASRSSALRTTLVVGEGRAAEAEGEPVAATSHPPRVARSRTRTLTRRGGDVGAVAAGVHAHRAAHRARARPTAHSSPVSPAAAVWRASTGSRTAAPARTTGGRVRSGQLDGRGERRRG